KRTIESQKGSQRLHQIDANIAAQLNRRLAQRQINAADILNLQACEPQLFQSAASKMGADKINETNLSVTSIVGTYATIKRRAMELTDSSTEAESLPFVETLHQNIDYLAKRVFPVVFLFFFILYWFALLYYVSKERKWLL